MLNNQSQVSAVRKMAEHAYNDKICNNFRRKGILCRSGTCGVGPCCDWDDSFLGAKLGDTIYVDMPNSIRSGRVSHRGSRGGKNGGGGKKGANKENSAGESSD